MPSHDDDVSRLYEVVEIGAVPADEAAVRARAGQVSEQLRQATSRALRI